MLSPTTQESSTQWNTSDLLSPALWAEKASRGRWQMARHLVLLSRELRQVALGRTKRLIVQMPPRHGKSELSSKYFPSWFLGCFPQKKIIIGSAIANLAERYSAEARDLLIEHGARFGVSVTQDKRSQKEWRLDQGGECYAAGVGGSLFGKGAHVAIVDDYHGSIEDALSLAEREKVHRWYQGTIRNRLEDENSAIVIVATRYHPEDLVGRLLEEQQHGGDKWRVIHLPALAGPNDELGRAEGEPLWPERWSREHLAKEKVAMAASGYPWLWEALYEGDPPKTIDAEFPREWFSDSIWFDSWSDGQEWECRAAAVDPSMGKTDKSDYSAIVFGGLARDGNYYVDADLQRRPVSQLATDVVEICRRNYCPILGVEAITFQELVADAISKAAEAASYREGHVVPMGNTLNKLVRIRQLGKYLATGRIRFKRNSPGALLLVQQLRGFPSCKHDDGPDALEMLTRLIEQHMAGAIGFGPVIEERLYA